MKNLGENLRIKRKNKKLTQQDVANILKIHQVTYQGYEKNKHIPDLETIEKLADIYDTSIDILVGRYVQQDRH